MVFHGGHACEFDPDVYCFEVLVGTTVAAIKGKLLDGRLRNSGWLADEMVMWEDCRPNVALTNNDDFEDDTTLWWNLYMCIVESFLFCFKGYVWKSKRVSDAIGVKETSSHHVALTS